MENIRTNEQGQIFLDITFVKKNTDPIRLAVFDVDEFIDSSSKNIIIRIPSIRGQLNETYDHDENFI